jgi:glutathione peroxidase-family protein
MARFSSLITLFLAFVAPTFAEEVIEGENSNCELWAKAKECDTNFAYMNKNCRKTCEKFWVKDEAIKDKNSIYDFTTLDISGEEFNFADLKGKAVIIGNIASKCGYAELHLKEMKELYFRYEGTGKFEMLAFPSNQFGDEPMDLPEIKEWMNLKRINFKVLTKVDVNYETADPIYKFLRYIAGPQIIDWNFTTYYIIAPDGTIESYSRETPRELDDAVKKVLFPDGEIPEDSGVKEFPAIKKPSKNLKKVLGIPDVDGGEEDDDEVTKEL